MSPDRLTALFRHPRFTDHDTGNHPENPSRYAAIELELERRGLLAERPAPEFQPATDEQILRVHTGNLIAELEAITAAGGGWIDADTLCGPDSLAVARLAAGAAVAAVDAVLDGPTRHAFALGRPPGHHATANRAMGFCLLNSIAIAAAHARSRGLRRVAIVDWDVHHGNGTQDIFYKDGSVLYCSMHQFPWYPGSGAASETGEGDGAGTTINAPLPAGSGDAACLAVFEHRFLHAIRAFQPELLLVSAGFDAHEEDPLAQLQLTDDGFRAMAGAISLLADELCEGRLVAVLEGGYDTTTLGRNVANIVEILDA
jgi:acetoin utilization deacetylase AcuC-like enzyme